MKHWYQTREGASLHHKNQLIAEGKRIFLTEAQAKLHGDKLENSKAPTKPEEAGINEEYEQWLKANRPTTKPQTKIVENKKN